MRKQLLAIFSMFGLAGSSASARAQVVKGSDADKTTTEGKIKSNKATQENKPALDAGSKDSAKLTKAHQEDAASKDALKAKVNKSGVENPTTTMRKAGGEQQAHQDVVTEKIGPDKTAHKHIGDVKYEKSAAEGAASKNEADYKYRKAGGEQNEMRKAGGSQDATIDVRKQGGNQLATDSDKQKKHIKANAALGDGSVRTSTTGNTGGGGEGKVAMHDIHIKNSKNAAETQAAQEATQKKADKATPK